MSRPKIETTSATESDFEELADLRVAAMRESLERVLDTAEPYQVERDLVLAEPESRLEQPPSHNALARRPTPAAAGRRSR